MFPALASRSEQLSAGKEVIDSEGQVWHKRSTQFAARNSSLLEPSRESSLTLRGFAICRADYHNLQALSAFAVGRFLSHRGHAS